MKTKPQRIGILATYRHEFGRDLINGVLDYKFRSASDNWQIAHISEWTQTAARDLRDAGLDGLIAPIYSEEDAYGSLGIPIVNTTEPIPDCRFPTVTCDNVAVGELAARTFVDLNVRCVYWMDYPDSRTFVARNKAFKAYLDAHGIPHKPIQYLQSPQKRSIVIVGRALPEMTFEVDLDPAHPIGIFCVDDTAGVIVLENCTRHGWQVPGQIVVLGVNNDRITCLTAEPELSSIAINHFEIGQLAAAQLDCLIRGVPLKAHCLRIPPEGIVHRHSTNRIDCNDPHVTEAMRYIHAHIDEYFDVSDIMRFMPISRRTLEQRFQQHLGQSIHEAIVAARLNRAETLLRETGLAQMDVARQSGFPNPHAFHAAFQRKHGMTPATYRARTR